MRRPLVLGVLGAVGLAVFLWPALAAPVVLWSDSRIDLAWARAGDGIVRPVWAAGHTAKPGYLLFLRLALSLGGGSERGVVVLQSLLLWASLTLGALFVSRRRGAAVGLGFFAAAFLFLRIRDSSSAVMSEALSIALAVPLAALALEPPVRAWTTAGAGALAGALFLVRPNVGLTGLVLLLLSFATLRRWRGALLALGVAAAVVAPLWIATRPPAEGDPTRGLTFSTFEASADDYWLPSLGPAPVPSAGGPAAVSRELALRAKANWRRTLAARGPDARRQLVWRALHGILGSELYDARWSDAYRRLDSAARTLSPLAVIAAVALLAARALDRGAGRVRLPLLGLAVVAIVVLQDLVLSSNPRFALPFLPVLFLFAAASAPSAARPGPAVAAGATLVLLAAAISVQASPLGREWGVVESAGVRIDQPIAAGALPARAPATLHVRIAAPLVPSAAGLRVTEGGSDVLYTSDADQSRRRPEISIGLPQALLDRNRRESVTLRFASEGAYGETSYLLFPVIPRPWRKAATREGSRELSPATGLAAGSLDWWAHEGADPPRSTD